MCSPEGRHGQTAGALWGEVVLIARDEQSKGRHGDTRGCCIRGWVALGEAVPEVALHSDGVDNRGLAAEDQAEGHVRSRDIPVEACHIRDRDRSPEEEDLGEDRRNHPAGKGIRLHRVRGGLGLDSATWLTGWDLKVLFWLSKQQLLGELTTLEG